MNGHDLRFNSAAAAVAIVLGGGIASVFCLMTADPPPPLVSCTAADCATNRYDGPNRQLDPLAPTAPPSKKH